MKEIVNNCLKINTCYLDYFFKKYTKDKKTIYFNIQYIVLI